MPDLIAISQGLSALRATTEILKTMAGLRDSAKLLENTVKLNHEILLVQGALADAQQEQTTLVKTIGELEKEIARFKTWENEKKRYQLKKLPPGVFVHSLKPELEADEPAHSICATCYERSKKSILHATETINGQHELLCHECDTKLEVGHFVAQQTGYLHLSDD